MGKSETDIQQHGSNGDDLKLRALGAAEKFRATLHDLHLHHNVTLFATFSKPGSFDGRLRSLVYFAFQIAVQEHAALASTVSGKDTLEPYFVRLKVIDLKRIVCFEKAASTAVEKHSQVDGILATQNSLGFTDPTVPLWRAIILENENSCESFRFDMFFIWHHVIGDGRSGLAAVATMLKAFNAATSGSIGQEIGNGASDADEDANAGVNDVHKGIIKSSKKSLELPLEEILKMPTSTAISPEQTFEAYSAPNSGQSAPGKKWSGKPYSTAASVKTKVQHICIPAPVVRRLLIHCHAEITTMTPLLVALIEKVVLKTFTDMDQIRCAIAISLRRFFPERYNIDDHVMGLWVSAFHIECTRDELQNSDNGHTEWNRARKNSERIKTVIAKGDPGIIVGQVQNAQDFKISLLGKLGQQRENSCGITNLGSFPLHVTHQGEYAGTQWCVQQLIFSQSCHVIGSAIQFCIVSLKEGDMSIVASWQEDIVEEEDVIRILHQLNTEITACSNDT